MDSPVSLAQPQREILRRLQQRATRQQRWSHATLVVGLLLAGIVVLSGLLSSWIAPASPNEIFLDATLQPPSMQHLMGTDELGRDVFSRVLYGIRLDLGVVLLMTYASLIIGVLLGATAGYLRGWTDTAIGRTIDVVLAFPFLVLVIGVIAITGPGLLGVVIGMTIVGWAVYGRLTRAEMLSLRERDFIAAARTLGYSDRRIMFKHALPNVVQPALVFSMSDIVLNLMTLAALSYLGLGVQPPTPELGSIVADGQDYLFSAWWISTLPGVVLVLIGVSFSLIGDAVAERLGEQFKMAA